MKVESLRALVETLIEQGIIVETRPISSRPLRRGLAISIGDPSGLPPSVACVEGSPEYYVEILQNNKASMIMWDGSVVQISYETRGGHIIKHRYCFIPAPCSIDLRTADGIDLAEHASVVFLNRPMGNSCRTILRFEFDPTAHKPGHPASHLHFNETECRVPLKGPISAKDFFSFLLTYMYSGEFNIEAFPATLEGQRTLSAQEEIGFHVSWRSRRV
jgi:hypothetical protein